MKKQALVLLGLGISAALFPATASAGITITPGSPADDPAFECLKGSTPACTPAAIQENWVAEGRIGGANTFEQAIIQWTSNTTNTTPANSNNTWSNGVSKPFSVKYLSSGSGSVNFDLNGTPITASSLTRSPSITTLYIRSASQSPNTNVSTSTTSLTNLFLDLLAEDGTTVIGSPISIGALSSTDGPRSYITVDGVTGNFQVRGDSTLSWTGLQPTQSNMAWQIKAAYKQAGVSVPGPLPVLGGLAAFGWSRKLRKRIQARKVLHVAKFGLQA